MPPSDIGMKSFTTLSPLRRVTMQRTTAARIMKTKKYLTDLTTLRTLGLMIFAVFD